MAELVVSIWESGTTDRWRFRRRVDPLMRRSEALSPSNEPNHGTCGVDDDLPMFSNDANRVHFRAPCDATESTSLHSNTPEGSRKLDMVSHVSYIYLDAMTCLVQPRTIPVFGPRLKT